MLKIGGGILTCVILCEALLRVKWGFCDTVLMRASDKYEYIDCRIRIECVLEIIYPIIVYPCVLLK